MKLALGEHLVIFSLIFLSGLCPKPWEEGSTGGEKSLSMADSFIYDILDGEMGLESHSLACSNRWVKSPGTLVSGMSQRVL